MVGRRRLVRGAQLARRDRDRDALAVSAGEVGGPQHYATYVLLANTSAFAGQARVTVLLEGGGTLERTFPCRRTAASTSTSARVPRRPSAAASATLVESLGTDPAELVVEWSIYGTPGARPWELGANALAMNLSSPLHTLADRAIVRGSGTTTIDTYRAIAGAPHADLLGEQFGARHRDGDDRRRTTGPCGSRRRSGTGIDDGHRHRPRRPASPTSSTRSC